MTDQVTSNLKEMSECGCGCGVYGILKKSPNRAGVRCVKAKCNCKSCKGRKVNARGNAAGTKARKRLGLVGANTRHEEAWGGPVRTESKSQGPARPVITAHNNAKAQSEHARPIGDNRPFIGSFTFGPRTVFTIDADELERVVFALAESWGFGEAS